MSSSWAQIAARAKHLPSPCMSDEKPNWAQIATLGKDLSPPYSSNEIIVPITKFCKDCFILLEENYEEFHCCCEWKHRDCAGQTHDILLYGDERECLDCGDNVENRYHCCCTVEPHCIGHSSVEQSSDQQDELIPEQTLPVGNFPYRKMFYDI